MAVVEPLLAVAITTGLLIAMLLVGHFATRSRGVA
jgi:hypothetical protein